MPSKFLSLEEAAKQLGVSTNELNEMRLRQEIYALRDGPGWKFKPDDVQRLIEERAGGGGPGSSILGSSHDDLLSEIEISPPSAGGSSTIIGPDKIGPSTDSDLKLSDDDFIPGSDAGSSDLGGSGLLLADEAASGLNLAGGSALGSGLALDSGTGGSDLGLGSDLSKGGDSDKGSALGLGSDILLVSPDQKSASSDVILAPPDDDVLSSPSEVPLSTADSATVVKSGSELALGESALIGGPGLTDLSGAPSGGSSLLGGDSLLAEEPSPGDSALHLADEDVLGGPGSGSDITHRPSDSGILLIDPSDSGLSLDKPIDLSSSDAMMQTTDFTAGEPEVKADDDFLLTPLEETTEDESDSGSQVIMLDTEGEFDDATATLLASQVPGLNTSMLVEEESPLGGIGALGEAPMPRTAAAGAGPVMVPAQPENQFSVLSVVGLAVCSVSLIICGIMMYDVVRNMWAWDSPYGVDSVIIKSLIK